MAMGSCVSTCCAEVYRGVRALRVETQSWMLTVEDGPVWMRFIVFAANVFATPWCLAFHLVRIYVLPCLYFTCCYADVLAVFYPRCLASKYEDAAFPADDSSLGALATGSAGVEWKRIEAAGGKGGAERAAKMRLFDGAIESRDVCQGALGDCWLLSAIACMTEFPGAIPMLFRSHKANPRGKYFVDLYDVQRRRWTKVTVDDRVPHRSGEPLFSKPHGDEAWVLLLEKAFAKLCGGYARIEGGLVVWAFQAMTGDAVATYVADAGGGAWERLEMRPKEDDADKRKVGLFSVSGDRINGAAMHALVRKFKTAGCVLGAGSRGRDDTLSEGRGEGGGIVPGHAYSILDAKKVDGFLLVKLRNPWGTFEWKGDWSDGSPLWGDHARVARHCGFVADAPDDGAFWMAWDDFKVYFDGIDVCFRTQGMRELHYEVAEEYGACGPVVGGLIGVGRFVCLCQGLYKMWCVREGTADELDEFEKGHVKLSDIEVGR